jgi:hypothetical protein
MVQKELRNFSQWFWKGFLKWYDGGGENRITSKRIFEVEVFFSSQNIDFPFYLKRLLELSFFPSLFFFMLGLLRTRAFWWYLRRKSLLQKFLFKCLQYTSGGRIFRMELCMPTWLNHDYWDGGVVEMLAVDSYSRVEVCTPIFLGEASN